MGGEELRKLLFKEFQKIFGQNDVKTKWRVYTNSSDDLDKSYMYTPETDVVVGPYNISRRIERDNKNINSAFEKYQGFLDSINQIATKKFDGDSLNPNPRCFIAIEVAGSGSEKHLLGDMFNVSILGKVGMVVGATEKKLETYQRIYEYVNFVHEVGKTTQHFGNVAILNGVEFLGFLKRLNKKSKN